MHDRRNPTFQAHREAMDAQRAYLEALRAALSAARAERDAAVRRYVESQLRWEER